MDTIKRNDGLRELALFAGAGGGILGGQLLGWRTVCAVERDPYARDVLVARQNDGSLHPFPIWDDVCTFDGRPWRGVVDVVSGGFPCQDISAAGKGAGITGSRSGLWSEMARIIGEVQPRYVWVENSPLLVSRGLGLVLSDLAALGYDARWGVVGAHHAGALHRRERIWILAYSTGLERTARPEVGVVNGQSHDIRVQCRNSSGSGAPLKILADAEITRLEGHRNCPAVAPNRQREGHAWPETRQNGIRQPEPRLGGTAHGLAEGLDSNPWHDHWEEGTPRVAKGIPNRADRLRCIGNGQVPQAMRLAWELLSHD